jgi:hypothetical protein
MDFTGGAWDFWADLRQPIDDVRARYHVEP